MKRIFRKLDWRRTEGPKPKAGSKDIDAGAIEAAEAIVAVTTCKVGGNGELSECVFTESLAPGEMGSNALMELGELKKEGYCSNVEGVAMLIIHLIAEGKRLDAIRNTIMNTYWPDEASIFRWAFMSGGPWIEKTLNGIGKSHVRERVSDTKGSIKISKVMNYSIHGMLDSLIRRVERILIK